MNIFTWRIMLFDFSRLNTFPMFSWTFSMIISTFPSSIISIFYLIGMIVWYFFSMMVYLLNFWSGIGSCVSWSRPFVRYIITSTVPFRTFVCFQITFVNLGPFSVIRVMTEIQDARITPSVWVSFLLLELTLRLGRNLPKASSNFLPFHSGFFYASVSCEHDVDFG